jgi:pimeloyl-ACP methyl ester carboxylesterase
VSVQDPTGDSLVLVPGAMVGPWIWDRTRHLLDGVPVVAPDLTSRRPHQTGQEPATLTTAADELAESIRGHGLERPVLVGHSLGGLLVWETCRRLAGRVAGLVMVAAEVPEQGRSWLDEQGRFARLAFRAAWAVRPRGVKPPGFVARRVLGHDLDEEAAGALLDDLHAEPPGMYTEPVGPLQPAVPVTYVRTTRDRALALDRQDAVARRVGATEVIDVDTGHLPMLARPPAMAEALLGHPALSPGG